MPFCRYVASLRYTFCMRQPQLLAEFGMDPLACAELQCQRAALGILAGPFHGAHNCEHVVTTVDIHIDYLV